MAAEALALLRSACADLRRNPNGDPEWNESWAVLQELCPDALSGAAEILDQKTVTRVIARSSKREYYLVEGNGRKAHTCLPGFCTCMSFCLSVASKPETLVCKHELAVLMADAFGRTLLRELDDDDWAAQFSLATTLPLMMYDPATAAGAVGPTAAPIPPASR